MSFPIGNILADLAADVQQFSRSGLFSPIQAGEAHDFTDQAWRDAA